MLSENYIVVIVESDFYARHAINSYLAWDRRTRVTQRFADLNQLTEYLSNAPEAEYPDTILLDSRLVDGKPDYAEASIKRILSLCQTDIIIMAHNPVAQIASAVYKAGAKGYVVRGDVGLQVSWMVGWSKAHPFIVSPQSAHLFPQAAILPNGREFPLLTDRVRQALMLCVVEGMSAQLAADEMGLSPHTIRTYIKEGYTILEAYDQFEYPADLSPQEKAFMRFTALALDNQESTAPKD